ncbi:MAG: NADH-quinone oxidoreductase subunit H, partial [Pseudomonadota bacterium]
RNGRPLLQSYYDIIKLVQKNFVYSKTICWIFPFGPIVGFSCLIACLCLVPVHVNNSIISFSGDFLLLIYLLGLMRFFMVSAAMDTGSSFEGMGANREIYFSFLIEPCFMAIFIGLCLMTREINMQDIFLQMGPALWFSLTPSLFFMAVSLFTILLLENSRIPFDDPNTHLELTMIHEVMVLDHGSLDLALITYSSAIKLWLFSALLARLIIPTHSNAIASDVLFNLVGVLLIGIIIGLVESTLTRIKIKSISKALVGVTILALLSMILQKGG